MIPRDYENIQRLLPRPVTNVNASSYFSPILTSSSNMSSSSTDTSSGSYESSLSFPCAEKQEFRPYQLFNSSCATSMKHSNGRDFIESSNYYSETPFCRNARATPKRNIIPETARKNIELDLINVLYPANETEISLPHSTMTPVSSCNTFSDFNLTPNHIPYMANTSENKWELHKNTLIPLHDSHHSADVFLETLDSSSGKSSETSISKNMSPCSLGYLPPVSPIRRFEKLNPSTGFSDSLIESSPLMSTGSKYMFTSTKKPANYNRKSYSPGSTSGTFWESSISPDSKMSNPGFMECKPPPHKYPINIERINRATSLGLYSENSFPPVIKKRPITNDYMAQASPIRNPIGFKTLHRDPRSPGRFSEPPISSITSISPGSIGYMPRVSPITNPINFENLNEDAKSSSGIKTDQICTFCKKNGERQKVYSTHSVKVKVGNKYIVTCPVLRSHVCSMCGGTGDNAHTVTYCPLVSDSNNKRPPSTTVTLKSTRMKSNGKIRYN